MLYRKTQCVKDYEFDLVNYMNAKIFPIHSCLMTCAYGHL